MSFRKRGYGENGLLVGPPPHRRSFIGLEEVEESGVLFEEQPLSREELVQRKKYFSTFSNLPTSQSKKRTKVTRTSSKSEKITRVRKTCTLNASKVTLKNSVPKARNSGNVPLQSSRETLIFDVNDDDSEKNPVISHHDSNLKYFNENDCIPDFEIEVDPIVSINDASTAKKRSSAGELAEEKRKRKRLENELSDLKDQFKNEKMLFQERLKIVEKTSPDNVMGHEREIISLKGELHRISSTVAKNSSLVQQMQKTKNLLIAKIMVEGNEMSDFEDETILMKLDVCALLSKYDQIMSAKRTGKVELEIAKNQVSSLQEKLQKVKRKNLKLKERNSALKKSNPSINVESNTEQSNLEKVQLELNEKTETMQNMKSKLQLQTEMRNTLEEQQDQIMDLLNVPKDDRSFLKTLNCLKQRLGNNFHPQEEEEIASYSNADSIINDHFAREKH